MERWRGGIAVVVLLLMLLTAAAGGARATSTPAVMAVPAGPTEQKIAYSGGDGEIYIVNPDGSVRAGSPTVKEPTRPRPFRLTANASPSPRTATGTGRST